jgi:hypothetical protein
MGPKYDPIHLRGDEYIRSSCIRELVHDSPAPISPESSCKIPRCIIQYWNDLTAVPSDVAGCIRSWNAFEAFGFSKILVDDRCARSFIERSFPTSIVMAFDRCNHPAMRADYFRLCYLHEHGGFYVDADDVYQGGNWEPLYSDNRLKLQPLCYDSGNDTMVTPDLFIRNKCVCSSWTFYVNNNPLIAPPHHPIIALALSRSTERLLSSSRDRIDIQATTGPGNLSASLVEHSQFLKSRGREADFTLLADWELMAQSRWPLSYRHDERNWRLWHHSE